MAASLRVTKLPRPSLRAIDLADDLRSVEEEEARASFASTTSQLLANLAPWMCFVVHANYATVGLNASGWDEGLKICRSFTSF